MLSAVRRARGTLAVLAALAVAGVIATAPPASAAGFRGFDGRIVFTRSAADPSLQGLYTASPDGTSVTQLTNQAGTPFTYTDFASYSPDGSQLAFRSDQGIEVMNADGTNAHTVLARPYAGMGLAWSPDGSQFAWMEWVNNSSTIKVADADGTNEHVLVAGSARDTYFPVWSPDLQHLAFTYFGPSSSIGIVDLDGTGGREMLSGSVRSVAYSPDGAQFVYSNSSGELHIVNVDGTQDTAIVDASAHASAPVWSPNGQWIAYSRSQVGAADGIWVIRTDGSEAHQVTHGEDTDPDWQTIVPLPNKAPHALATAQNRGPQALFGNADASYDEDGSIVKYEWHWGDYTPVTLGKHAWHVYAAPGTYFVRVTVTDDDGAKTTRASWINVS
ncbi:MAG TPA: PKD domain-containing protein [Acidimicrobiales bacterium]|nr:PKD domain-containing protein [Acidimicrobiales bacterium]